MYLVSQYQKKTTVEYEYEEPLQISLQVHNSCPVMAKISTVHVKLYSSTNFSGSGKISGSWSATPSAWTTGVYNDNQSFTDITRYD